MPKFRITVINQTFTASDDHELASLNEAEKQGIKAALAIGVEEVANGNPYFGAEIRVEEDDETVGRFVVSIGASSLQKSRASAPL